MAITLITQPAATTPITNSDYTQQNLLLNGVMAQGDEVLTDWTDTVTEPDIKLGTYFYHSGNLYQTQSADESISGSIADGVNYIVLTASGTVLTAAYATSLTGYTWNPAYNGMYNGTSLIIKSMVYKEGTDNNRGVFISSPTNGSVGLANDRILSANSLILGDNTAVGNIKGSRLEQTLSSVADDTSYSRAEMYALLNPHIPTSGDKVLLSGYILENGNNSTSGKIYAKIYTLAYAERISSAEINVYSTVLYTIENSVGTPTVSLVRQATDVIEDITASNTSQIETVPYHTVTYTRFVVGQRVS